MDINYVLVDENNAHGRNIDIHQGEIKTISVYFLDAVMGIPKAFSSISEVVVKLFEGVATPALVKKLSLSQVTLLSGLTGTIGISFPLAAADILVVKPPDFDSTRRYPVLFSVYGEPAGQTVLDQWDDGYLWNVLLTQHGYVVASVDNRGTPSPRGRAFRKAIYKKVGMQSLNKS